MDFPDDQATSELCRKVIGAAFEVSNILGHGFLELVYRHAMLHELADQGIGSETEVRFPIEYKGKMIGTYVADLVVENRLIVELKAVDKLVPAHIGQVVNYLSASGLRIGLLFNFGKPKVEFRRIVR